MATVSITNINQLPMGCLRATFGTNIVALFDSQLPLSNTTDLQNFSNLMQAGDKAKRYWVFSFPVTYMHLNNVTNDLSILIPNNLAVHSFGYDSFDDAQNKYAALSLSDNGKAVPQGVSGLFNIGTTDS